MGEVLFDIAASVKKRLALRKSKRPLEKIVGEIKRKPHDFTKAFRRSVQTASRQRVMITEPAVIAEVKFASPSFVSVHNSSLDQAKNVARQYLQNGAAALSILTEQDFFKGSPDFLSGVRKENPEALILMKDFVVDPYQIFEGACLGADAVLLIVSLLSRDELHEFRSTAAKLGLTCLVEVHDEEEMRIASDLGAALIGVNNRNLKNLSTSFEISRKLAPLAPAQSCLICESGLSKREDLDSMSELGFSGFLVGSTMMKQQDPGEALRRLLHRE